MEQRPSEAADGTAGADGTLTAQMWQRIESLGTLRKLMQHEFVRALGDGSLPEATFRCLPLLRLAWSSMACRFSSELEI